MILRYKWIFRQVFRDKNRNVTMSVKNVTDKQNFISNGRALLKKTDYEIFIQKWRKVDVLNGKVLELWNFLLM